MPSEVPEADELDQSQQRKHVLKPTAADLEKAREAKAANRIALKTVCAVTIDKFVRDRTTCWGADRLKQVAGLIDKARAGNITAALGLKCWDCCAGERNEVAKCDITDCPNWPHRPWQR